jgi:hypothetical protein
MPILQTPKTFAAAWTRKFAENIDAAAGRDGRLSTREAERIGERTDGNRLWSDNAVNYLRALGQATVSAQKVVAAGTAYVLAAAAKAAGPDGRLSQKDGTKLPPDLRDDFIYLRSGVDEPLPSTAELLPGARDMALRALQNGTAEKLSHPPAEVRGSRPLVENVADPTSPTLRFSLWMTPAQDVYLSRASSSPSSLVGWYAVGRYGSEAAERGKLRGEVEHVTKDLWLPSESDGRIHFILAEHIDSEAIDEEMVRGKFTAVHDVLGPNVYGFPNPSFVRLDEKLAEPPRPALPYLNRLATSADPEDPQSVARAAKFAQLRDVLQCNLTDLTLFRFGPTDISVFIVGRTRSGDLAGVYSAVVET